MSQARSGAVFGGSAYDLTKWTKAEKQNGQLGPVRAKRMSGGEIYSEDEFEEEAPKRRKTAGRGRKKMVRSYC